MKKALFTCLLFCLGQIAFGADLTVTVTHSSSGLNNGAIDLTVSGGVSPFAYSWKGPAGFNASTQDVSGLAPGTYIVTVTDTYCGSATLTVQVNGPTGIPEISGFAFSVYPNPAKREISITTDILLTNASAKLINASGQTVMEKHNLNGTTFLFDLSEQAGGMYFIEIKNAGRFSRTKFLKTP